MLLLLLRFTWFSANLLLILKFIWPALDMITSYGKLQHPSVFGSVTTKTVFSTTYILANVWNLLLIFLLKNWLVDGCLPSFLEKIFFVIFPIQYPLPWEYFEQVLPFLIVFQIQVFRRCCECLFVQQWTEKRTSLLNLFLAPPFYLLLNVAVVVEILSNPNKNLLIFQPLIGVSIFLYASYRQFCCHNILAQLRSSKNKNYSIPYGDSFELVSCPHYFWEIIIYISFLVIVESKCLSMWFILLFVILNLGHSGWKTHQWYKKLFNDDYPKYRRAIIPYIFLKTKELNLLHVTLYT